jgi:hypothetical protein
MSEAVQILLPSWVIGRTDLTTCETSNANAGIERVKARSAVRKNLTLNSYGKRSGDLNLGPHGREFRWMGEEIYRIVDRTSRRLSPC